MTVLTRCSNGVSYGKKYTAVAQDATDGEIIIDFQVSYDLAGVVQVLRAGVDVTGDAVITFPEAGQISIADGETLAVTAEDVVVIVANRNI
jgi:hypothetical protein